jgi:hypothetical protein
MTAGYTHCNKADSAIVCHASREKQDAGGGHMLHALRTHLAVASRMHKPSGKAAHQLTNTHIAFPCAHRLSCNAHQCRACQAGVVDAYLSSCWQCRGLRRRERWRHCRRRCWRRHAWWRLRMGRRWGRRHDAERRRQALLCCQQAVACCSRRRACMRTMLVKSAARTCSEAAVATPCRRSAQTATN